MSDVVPTALLNAAIAFGDLSLWYVLGMLLILGVMYVGPVVGAINMIVHLVAVCSPRLVPPMLVHLTTFSAALLAAGLVVVGMGDGTWEPISILVIGFAALGLFSWAVYLWRMRQLSSDEAPRPRR